jgi:hypothetical protein
MRCLGIRAILDEPTDNLVLLASRSHHQHCAALFIRCVDVREELFDECAYYVQVAVLSREVERRATVVVSLVDVCTQLCDQC